MTIAPPRALAIAWAPMLAGCAGKHRVALSWVPPQADADASAIALEIASWVDMQAPAATSTILLNPVRRRQRGNAVTDELESDLRSVGFGIATDLASWPDAKVLRYEVTPIWSRHVVLVMQLDDVQATQLFYRQDGGGLVPAAPMSVRVTL